MQIERAGGSCRLYPLCPDDNARAHRLHDDDDDINYDDDNYDDDNYDDDNCDDGNANCSGTPIVVNFDKILQCSGILFSVSESLH